jgi:hypothetical protein
MEPTAAERAAAAIGRLDGAVLHHPLAAAWSLRSRIEAAIQAAAWNGWKVEKSRLCAILAGVHLKVHRDEGAEARAVALVALLGDMQSVSDLKPLSPAVLKASTKKRQHMSIEDLTAAGGDYVDIEGHREHGQVMLDFGRRYRAEAKSPLLALAELAAQVRAHREALPGVLHYAIPMLLAEWVLTSSPLPGLGAFPARNEDDVAWKIAFLDGLRISAERGLARLVEIGHVWDRSLAALGERRSSSRAVEAMLLAVSMPALSPSVLARLLTERNGKPATIRGATLILDELVAIGLLEELPAGRRKAEVPGKATRRTGAWRSYCMVEFGVGYEARPDSPALPSPTRAAAARAASTAAADLDALLDGLNLAIERSSALLAKHGIAEVKL